MNQNERSTETPPFAPFSRGEKKRARPEPTPPPREIDLEDPGVVIHFVVPVTDAGAVDAHGGPAALGQAIHDAIERDGLEAVFRRVTRRRGGASS